MSKADGVKKKTNKAVIVIAVLIILGVPIVANIIIQGQRQGNNYAVEENTTNPEQVAAEKACQEFITNNQLLAKPQFIDRDTEVITAVDYNAEYHDNVSGNDKNGNEIKLLNWNGEDKDGLVPFSCWISGATTDNTEIHLIRAKGVVIHGSEDFKTY